MNKRSPRVDIFQAWAMWKEHLFTSVVEKASSVAWMLVLVSQNYFWLSRRIGTIWYLVSEMRIGEMRLTHLFLLSSLYLLSFLVSGSWTLIVLYNYSNNCLNILLGIILLEDPHLFTSRDYWNGGDNQHHYHQYHWYHCCCSWGGSWCNRSNSHCSVHCYHLLLDQKKEDEIPRFREGEKDLPYQYWKKHKGNRLLSWMLCLRQCCDIHFSRNHAVQ